ncbi:MAG: ATP-binding protein [Pseudomonadota bacterium]
MQEEFGTIGSSNDASAHANQLRLSEGPLDLSWHHCSTTSDFIGDFFAARAAASNLDQTEAQHSICYLVNELLENAVKFRAPGDIEIDTSLEAGNFELKVSNLVEEETARRFQDLLGEITSKDPGELLIERIEQNALDPESSASGLGLLTLMSDYGAHLGWRFSRPSTTGPVRLETFAALSLS